MAYKRRSPQPVVEGGTGDSSFTAYSVVCGGTTSTGSLQNVSGVGSSGQVLTSNGASSLPTWQSTSGGATGSFVGMGRLASMFSTSAKTWGTPFGIAFGTTQADEEYVVPLNGTFSNLYVNIDTNSNTASGTVTVNHNGTNTTLVATVTASTTGIFSDTSHSFSVSQGDRVQFEISQGTTGTAAGSISVKFVPS